jgi:hypothetical protein
MPTHNRTYHHRKDKHVAITALDEKRQITAVVASSMEGELLPLQLVFKGQDTNPNEQRAIPKDKETTCLINKHKWKLEQTPNHWSSQYTMQRYVQTIIEPFIKSQINKHKLNPDSHALLIIDCWSVHKSIRFKEWMEKNYPHYHIIFVPAGCTAVAQPADVIFQRPLKQEYKNKFTEWTTTQMLENIKAGQKALDSKLLRDTRTLKPLIVKWAIESWLKLKEKKQLIKEGWNKIGWNRMLHPELQSEALKLLNKKELKLSEDNDEIEEQSDETEEDEDDDEEGKQEEEEDNEEEEREEEETELALARCIQNADMLQQRRRSARNSTFYNTTLIQALEAQDVDVCIRLD